jgi:hypothetical protein
MFWSRRNRRFLKLAGARLIALAASLIYLAAAMGLHLPQPTSKDTSQAFPCMHSRCGCRDAEQCWKSCCCHTVAERRAWAEEHNVAVPEELLADASKTRPVAKCKDGGACRHNNSTCAVAAKPTSRSSKLSNSPVCRLDTATACMKCGFKERAPRTESRLDGQDDSISIAQALKCQGAGASWNGVLPAVPLVLIRWSPPTNCCGWMSIASFSYSIERPDLLLRPPIV